MRISLDISESGVNPPTDMQWLESFGHALARQLGQDSVLVAVVAADGIIPVTVNAQGTIESVRRQLELGGPHASFALNALPDELGLNQSDAWLTQFAFYGQGVGLDMPGHDLAAKVTQSTDGRLDFILAFDGTVLDTTFIRALFDRATACLALRWDGDMQTVRRDEEKPAAPQYAPDRRLLTAPSDDALITSEASRLLEQIDNDQASSHFRRAWTLSQAIRVAPAVDVTRLQQAVSALTARHESLRIRLAGERGDRRPRLGLADCHVGTHDYSLTPPETYMTVVQELASRPLLPEGETLFEVHLLRFDGFDVVVVKVFEAIADGWSLALICDQLIRSYIGLDLGSPPPSLAQAKTLLAQHPVDTGAIAAFETLPPIPWANVGAPPEAARASPLTLGRSERFTVRLTPAQALFLRDSARALRTSENALLAAAYAKAIAMAGHVDDVLLHVVHPGRSLPALETVVGFLRQSTFVVARSLDNNSLGATARSIADQFLTMSDPGELSDMLAAKKLMADGALSAQALPTRFGYARLLADRTLDGTLMGTLADHQDATISAFSLQIEPLDINLFGLQENQLQLRPLSRADGIDLNFYFDCEAFTLEDVEDIAGSLVGQLLHPAPASTDDTLRPSPAFFEREELMSK